MAAFFLNNSAFSQTLKWYNFNEGYKKAVAENKPLLVKIYVEWDGWGKKMDKDTYSKKEVIDPINKSFIAVALNPETDGEYTFNGKKCNAKQLVDELTENKLSGYPSTVFYLLKKKKTYMEVGYKGKEDMINLLARYSKMK